MLAPCSCCPRSLASARCLDPGSDARGGIVLRRWRWRLVPRSPTNAVDARCTLGRCARHVGETERAEDANSIHVITSVEIRCPAPVARRGRVSTEEAERRGSASPHRERFVFDSRARLRRKAPRLFRASNAITRIRSYSSSLTFTPIIRSRRSFVVRMGPRFIDNVAPLGTRVESSTRKNKGETLMMVNF